MTAPRSCLFWHEPETARGGVPVFSCDVIGMQQVCYHLVLQPCCYVTTCVLSAAHPMKGLIRPDNSLETFMFGRYSLQFDC